MARTRLTDLRRNLPTFTVLLVKCVLKRGVLLVWFDDGRGMFLRNLCFLRPDGVAVLYNNPVQLFSRLAQLELCTTVQSVSTVGTLYNCSVG